jgi:hypothetical protein
MPKRARYASQMSVTYLDPTSAPGLAVEPYGVASLAPGRAATIGLLANGFPDSVPFLDHVERALLAVAPAGTVIKRWAKPNASAIVSDQVLQAMTDECEAVVTSYGH